MPVWAEDSNGSIVARHLLGLLLDDAQSVASRIAFFVAYSGTSKCEKTTKAKTRLKMKRWYMRLMSLYAACASTSKNKLFIVYNIYTSIRKFRIALVASYG